jgi:hypothetical protein
MLLLRAESRLGTEYGLGLGLWFWFWLKLRYGLRLGFDVTCEVCHGLDQLGRLLVHRQRGERSRRLRRSLGRRGLGDRQRLGVELRVTRVGREDGVRQFVFARLVERLRRRAGCIQKFLVGCVRDVRFGQVDRVEYGLGRMLRLRYVRDLGGFLRVRVRGCGCGVWFRPGLYRELWLRIELRLHTELRVRRELRLCRRCPRLWLSRCLSRWLRCRFWLSLGLWLGRGLTVWFGLLLRCGLVDDWRVDGWCFGD